MAAAAAGVPPTSEHRLRAPLRAWTTVATYSVLATMVAPTTYASAGYPSIRNPFGLEAYADVFGAADAVLELLLLAAVVFSGAALLARLRTADGVRREQLKWFAYAATLILISFLVSDLAK